MSSPAPGTVPEIYRPTAVSTGNETSAAALGARARADIEARTIVALNRPRDVTTFRRVLLEACARREFAALARYVITRGQNQIEGFTIRFAEECVRHYRNLDISTMVVSESDDQRVVRCSVTDLESNVPWSTEVVVPKTIERRFVDKDDEVVRKRKNSNGQDVFIRRATEDEIANTQNRLCAKATRNLVLNHIPSDIREDAEQAIFDTMQREEAAEASDPTSVRKTVADMFYRIGVTAVQLGEFLGHPVDQMTPAELHVLRKIYNAMKSEGVAWAEVMEQKRGGKPADPPVASAPQQERHKGGVDAALDKMEAASPKTEAPAADVVIEPVKSAEPAPLIPASIVRMLELRQAGKKLAPEPADDLRQFFTDATAEQLAHIAEHYPAVPTTPGA